MSDNELFFWCIRGGSMGEADGLFLKDNFIAVGWTKVGDPSQLPVDKDAFKQAAAQAYPEAKPGAIPVYAGVLYRFVHDMKPADLVVYPSKIDGYFHIGRIEGSFEHNPQRAVQFPNQRSVTWLKKVARTYFSQGALAEANAMVTLFQIRNYAEEFERALAGKPPVVSVEEDITIDEVALESKETTRDFIRKRLSTSLKGFPFESFVAELLRAMGYRARTTRKAADGGVDIIAHKDELGLQPPIIKVQVKCVDGNVGDPDVSALYGKVDPSEVGLFVTLGGFSAQARSFAQTKHNLRLLDGEELLDLILEHYENLDPQHQAVIPLERIYVPVRVKTSEDDE